MVYGCYNHYEHWYQTRYVLQESNGKMNEDELKGVPFGGVIPISRNGSYHLQQTTSLQSDHQEFQLLKLVYWFEYKYKQPLQHEPTASLPQLQSHVFKNEKEIKCEEIDDDARNLGESSF